MAYSATQLGYARTIVTVGRQMGVTVRGIKIGLATALVETNLLNYANRAVPKSLTVPHDAIGSDSKSVGIMQQQPQWWGDGTGVDLMQPAIAARLFFEQLLRLDYNGSGTPGSYAQTVQRSAYPARYDQRFAEASALYDQVQGDVAAGTTTPPTGGSTVAPDYGITHTIFGYNAGSAGTGNSNGPRARTDFIGIHTQEGGNGDAIGLAKYANGAEVAYNIEVDDQFTVLNVPVIEGPWAAADANNVAFHLCFAGSYAAWSASRWLSKDASDGLDEDAMLWRGAKAVAAACRQFNVPAKHVGAVAYAAGNWPGERGICGHVAFGSRGGGHFDPGTGFPWAEFIRRVLTFLTPTAVPNLIDAEAKVAAAWLGKRITDGEQAITAKGTKLGAFAAFDNGHIYWRMGANAAYAIPHGGLFEAYTERKWETGPLGFPVLRHQVVTAHGVTGGVQSFQGGVLMVPQGGAVAGYVVHGEIGKAYAAQDWEQGALGWPKSDEYPYPAMGAGCIRQDFTGGSLVWTPTGVVSVAA